MNAVTPNDLSRILRAQAWERAKGELRSMLWTYQSPANANEGQFEAFNEQMELFISEIEREGLHE